MSFRAERLGFAYGLEDVSFELPSKGLVAVTGPNGAGKSTLLGVLAGLRAPYRGAAAYTGREIRSWPRREFARKVAFLSQSLRVEFPFTVEEVVLMGRAPFARGWFESPEDHEAAARAMKITETIEFRARDIRTLSGGERQRAVLASALAQDPETLLLDEPATFLDLRHQLALYRLIAGLARNMLVVAVTHDLNLALRFANHVLVLESGRLKAHGSPQQVLSPALIREVFGVTAAVLAGPGQLPWLAYEA